MPTTTLPAVRSRSRILAALRAKRDSCALHNTTFLNQDIEEVTGSVALGLTAEEKDAVSQVQRRAFLNWWDSWIAPLLDELEVTNPDTGKN